MSLLEEIQKTREYLDYIEEHYLNVQKAWKEVKGKCSNMRFIRDDFYFNFLDSEIKDHDESKLSEAEFVPYRNTFYPVKGQKKPGLGKAWEHHKEKNYHHWETWTQHSKTNNPNEWEVHCVHMVVDWMAMGYVFEDNAKEYYEKHKDDINLPHYAIEFMYKIFDKLGY